jgi:hypothetical protein
VLLHGIQGRNLLEMRAGSNQLAHNKAVAHEPVRHDYRRIVLPLGQL